MGRLVNPDPKRVKPMGGARNTVPLEPPPHAGPHHRLRRVAAQRARLRGHAGGAGHPAPPEAGTEDPMKRPCLCVGCYRCIHCSRIDMDLRRVARDFTVNDEAWCWFVYQHLADDLDRLLEVPS